MSTATVKAHLAEFGADSRVHFLPDTSATVELAAKAIGVEPDRIAKSLAIRLKGGGEALILVAKGGARLDNAKFKGRFGGKAAFVPREECEAVTGHPPGGVCPFGLPAGLKVYLDVTLKQFDRLYPAAGAPNNYIEVGLDELEAWSGGEWVDVCAAGTANA